MESPQDREGTLTLGVLVVRLRPGYACLCCGTALQPAGAPGRAAGAGGRNGRDSPARVAAKCPLCGCEVAEADADWIDVGGCAALDSAA